METTTLYRLFAENDELLYVGVSGNWVVRMLEHRKLKEWWHEVVRVDLTTYPSRAEAIEAEAFAIRAETPVFNVIGTTGNWDQLVEAFPELDFCLSWVELALPFGEDPQSALARAVEEAEKLAPGTEAPALLEARARAKGWLAYVPSNLLSGETPGSLSAAIAHVSSSSAC